MGVVVSDVTPRQRIELACEVHGEAAVAQACVRLMTGEPPDQLMREVFGSQHSPAWLEDPVNAYWLRVWGARGLMWNWDVRAVPALRRSLDDPAWRVREMAVKVVARRLVDDLQPEVAGRQHDPVLRVRTAATRAVMRLAGAAGPGRT